MAKKWRWLNQFWHAVLPLKSSYIRNQAVGIEHNTLVANIEHQLRRALTDIQDLKEEVTKLKGANNQPMASVPLPTDTMLFRVGGSTSSADFLHIGRRCAQDIEIALARIDRDIRSFDHILDFGCGCGRTIRWYLPIHRPGQFFGSDIDAEAIAWCSSNLSFGTFARNDAVPPLSYESATFDLIYAISVFTHINEEYQLRWIAELERITKPNGIVILTFHGESTFHNLDDAARKEIMARGMVFKNGGTWKEHFPDWYGTSYHTEKYVREQFGRYFDVLDYIPRGIVDHQDMVTLRKRTH